MKRIEIEGTLTRFTGIDYETVLEFTGLDDEGRNFQGTQIQEVFGPMISNEGFPGSKKVKIIVEIQE